MTRDETPHKTPEVAPDGRIGLLAAMREHASRLTRDLPGQPSRLRLRSGDVVLEVEWAAPPAPAAGSPPAAGPLPAGAADSSGIQPARQTSGAEASDTPSGPVVTAPMVGTFYRSPQPGAEPFVQVGDLVEPGDTVGILEAMKLMNPVRAEAAGKVDRIAVADGEPVEFGQVLITLVPVG
ncbi:MULTISPECIES: acetyl-CoA carboxylase biotin carboxyl carrier protein [Protofrankia]|uniref:Biotin carboxyl carrier protein of acetyl-CoA carboxylase n=1 Tax=Candidatus Protofrankia datiscae TaxID=2716812 RepID=F8B0H9_9ACTN|nr:MULTISPECIES: acetyl-CoA carboxylase biotin carboxyl carrier protein [Protofrankia]AEH09728.1 acetyl-CoA carboxylase, biotin carboxyl carrier protein [Candidatus Protofrankia datiscae]